MDFKITLPTFRMACAQASECLNWVKELCLADNLTLTYESEDGSVMKPVENNLEYMPISTPESAYGHTVSDIVDWMMSLVALNNKVLVPNSTIRIAMMNGAVGKYSVDTIEGSPRVQKFHPELVFDMLAKCCRDLAAAHNINDGDYDIIINLNNGHIQKMTIKEVDDMYRAMMLCEGRHAIPQAVDGAIYPNTIDPLDVTGLEAHALRALEGVDKLDLYVTGLTVALVAVLNACRRLGVQCNLYHYDRESGQYYPQEVL